MFFTLNTNGNATEIKSFHFLCNPQTIEKKNFSNSVNSRLGRTDWLENNFKSKVKDNGREH